MKQNTRRKLIKIIAVLDNAVNKQVNLIFANNELQELLSCWLELKIIVDAKKSEVILKLLNLSWQDLDKDIGTSIDIESTRLYNLLYENELGVAGGIPFGIVLGQYYVDINNRRNQSTLKRVAELSSNTLCPFITNVLNKNIEIATSSKSTELITEKIQNWNQHLQQAYAQFLYLCFPHMIARVDKDVYGIFEFKLRTGALFALQIIQSFQNNGWFDSVLNPTEAQTLTGFDEFYTSYGMEFLLSNTDEQTLVAENITILTQQNITGKLCFLSFPDNTSNTTIEHILCASRFGHFIKQIARSKIGSFQDETKCETYLHRWLNAYTSTTSSRDLKLRYPLKSHNIKLQKVPGKIGHYNCKILLEPHMKLENINSKIILQSEIIKLQ